jgi:hypothetical protein
VRLFKEIASFVSVCHAACRTAPANVHKGDGILRPDQRIDLLMSLARSRVTRNLTPEECRQYLHLDEVPPIA